MVIPEAAVEAALGAFYQGAAAVHPHDRASMRAALGAAVPHMLAEAWDDGAETMERSTWPDGDMPENPYRSKP